MSTWVNRGISGVALGVGAGLGGWGLYKHGDQETSGFDRAATGGALGGIAAYGLSTEKVRGFLYNFGKNRYQSKLEKFRTLGRTRSDLSGIQVFNKTFGSRIAYAGAGALIGSLVSEDSSQGATIGALAGIGIRGATEGHSLYKLLDKRFAYRAWKDHPGLKAQAARYSSDPVKAERWMRATAAKREAALVERVGYGRVGGLGKGVSGAAKLGLIAALGLAVGAAAYNKEAGAEYEPEVSGASTSYVPRGSGTSQRMSAIGADGTIVFGMHNKR